MTIIRPTSAQDIARKAQLQEAANKAKLTLSETLALNMKYGTNLEYAPQSDMIEITSYVGKRIKNIDSPFEQICSELAFNMSDKLKNGVMHHIKIRNSLSSSFDGNLKAAIKKLKSVL